MKLKPEVFEAAAERIANKTNFMCCIALRQSETGCSHEALFSSVFKQRNDHDSWWDIKCRPQDQNARIFALLLCAEMCRPTKRKRKP